MRVGATLVLAFAALCGSVAVAAASSSDAQATHAYLIAQYRLATALLHESAAARGAETGAAAQIARACRGVVSKMPQEVSVKHSLAPTARVRGENARLFDQKETIADELDVAVIRAGDSLDRPADEAYAAEVRPLSWSNPTIAPAVQAAITAKLEAVSAPAPPFCADARTWAHSGYRVLSAASRKFKASQAAQRSSREGEPSVKTLLKPYENASDRALIHKTNASAKKLLVSALAVVQTVERLDRIVGFPLAPDEPKQITLGHGRTAAGTRFDVSTGSAGVLGAGGSCHRSATVAYSRPATPGALIVGGPNNPICLSPPKYRHPALFCEAGIETIQTAVPPSVRSATLVLADGRKIESRVVGASRGDGDTAGIYAQELRGSTSHATTIVELNADQGVVLTLKLPRYRCAKPRKKPEDLLRSTKLTSGRTAEGEPFTISALGSINGEPFLSADIGVNPELNEPTIGPGANRPFLWSLSLGCAPHPYAILYGILAPPGTSVTAQTPEGAVALKVVPIQRRVHAKGPLVYGAFSAVPTELTVLGANGSIVYSENLQTQAAEATQFCEGYAEP